MDETLIQEVRRTPASRHFDWHSGQWNIELRVFGWTSKRLHVRGRYVGWEASDEQLLFPLRGVAIHLAVGLETRGKKAERFSFLDTAYTLTDLRSEVC